MEYCSITVRFLTCGCKLQDHIYIFFKKYIFVFGNSLSELLTCFLKLKTNLQLFTEQEENVLEAVQTSESC